MNIYQAVDRVYACNLDALINFSMHALVSRTIYSDRILSFTRLSDMSLVSKRGVYE